MLETLPKAPILTDEQLSENDKQQKAWAKPRRDRFTVIAEAVVNELKDVERSPKQEERYNDALRTLGRFKDSGDDDLWKAVWRNDDEMCDCPDTHTQQNVNGKIEPVTISRLYKKKRVYSVKHQDFRHLWECSICGEVNIR